MANKDDSAPGGLLSRVVRFVRNPASGFNENEVQASTYVPGEGWARPVDLPVQANAASRQE